MHQGSHRPADGGLFLSQRTSALASPAVAGIWNDKTRLTFGVACGFKASSSGFGRIERRSGGSLEFLSR